MIQIDNVWYAPFDSLVSQCFISEETIKKGILRGSKQWQSIADPSDRRKRLIRYDTLADKYKGIVRRVLCMGYEPGEIPAKPDAPLLSERSLLERLEAACLQGFRQYIGLYPVDSTDERYRRMTQNALARAAAIVEAIGCHMLETGGNWRNYAPFEQAVEWLTPDYDQYFPKGHQYLPLDVKNLKERVLQRYVGPKPAGTARLEQPLPITEVIRLPRQGNKNRDQFSTDEQILAWTIQARRDFYNWTDVEVARKVRQVCALMDKAQPSFEWFAKLLATPQVRQLTTGRYGHQGKHAALYQPYITMQRPLYAGDCWQVDATRINFVEHKAFDGKGKQYLFIVAIRDVYSGEIVGVDFGIHENRYTYVNAFKMAVKYTGHLPCMLVHDRFPGHMTDEMQAILQRMEAKGVKLVCTHNAQGKAAIERWFDTLQTVFLSQSRYYYGQGILSTRPSAHRTPQYMVNLRKEANREGWDFDAAWQEAWDCVDQYRQTPLSHYSRKHRHVDDTPMGLYRQSEKPHVIEFDNAWDQAALFWLETTVTVQRDQVKMTVDKQDYIYPIRDTQLLYKCSNQQVVVRYDDIDLRTVMLFVPGTDEFIGQLGETPPVPMYGPNVDQGEFHKQRAINKRLAEQKQADSDALAAQAPDYMTLLQRGLASKDQQIEAESLAIQVLDQMSDTRTKLTRKALAIKTTQPLKGTQPVKANAQLTNVIRIEDLPDYGPNAPGAKWTY